MIASPLAGKPDWVVWGLLAIAGVLLLARLDNGLLWQDEAETALLARHVLRFGYPRVSDGRSPMEIVSPYTHGPDEAWIYSPWAPFYLLAGVFAVFGESTAIARAPFALCGWLSIWLAWQLARHAGFSRQVQRLTVALLTFSVPVLLHMRQCRYYGMVTAIVLAICWLYLAWDERPTWPRSLGLGMLLGALFHNELRNLHSGRMCAGVPLPAVGVAEVALAMVDDRDGSRRADRAMGGRVLSAGHLC